MDDGRVVTNFIAQALSNKPITIYGRGDQTRSFCYVDDLLDAICLLMNSSDEVTGPINLGNPGEFTMLELADKVIALTGSSSSLVFEPLPLDDPKMRKPDLTLTQKTIQWQPKVSLDEGLKATVNAFTSNE
jgi:UDP-glucuronate decarboxylase